MQSRDASESGGTRWCNAQRFADYSAALLSSVGKHLEIETAVLKKLYAKLANAGWRCKTRGIHVSFMTQDSGCAITVEPALNGPHHSISSTPSLV